MHKQREITLNSKVKMYRLQYSIAKNYSMHKQRDITLNSKVKMYRLQCNIVKNYFAA